MRSHYAALIFGLIAVTMEVALALAVSPRASDPAAYQATEAPLGYRLAENGLARKWGRLGNWDTYHYYAIAAHGYRFPPQGEALTPQAIERFEVSGPFFPLFPGTARFFHEVTGVSLELSLILVSQLSALAFWILWWLTLGAGGVAPARRILFSLPILFHPGAIFLVLGYSEAVHCLTLIGFVCLFTRRVTRTTRITLWTDILGMALTTSRALGGTLAVLPLLTLLDSKRARRDRVQSALTLTAMVVSAVGLWTWFDLQSGRPGYLSLLQQVGWSHEWDFLAPFKLALLIPQFGMEPDIVAYNQLLALLTWAGCAGGAWIWIARFRSKNKSPELRQDLSISLGLILAAGAQLFVALASKAHSKMDGVLRYSFPIWILLTLSIFFLLKNQPSEPASWPRSRVMKVLIALGVLVGLALQGIIAYRFTHGKWIT